MQIVNRAVKAVLEQEDVQALEKAWAVLAKIYRLIDGNTERVVFSEGDIFSKTELKRSMDIINRFNTLEPFEVY